MYTAIIRQKYPNVLATIIEDYFEPGLFVYAEEEDNTTIAVHSLIGGIWTRLRSFRVPSALPWSRAYTGSIVYSYEVVPNEPIVYWDIGLSIWLNFCELHRVELPPPPEHCQQINLYLNPDYTVLMCNSTMTLYILTAKTWSECCNLHTRYRDIVLIGNAVYWSNGYNNISRYDLVTAQLNHGALPDPELTGSTLLESESHVIILFGLDHHYEIRRLDETGEMWTWHRIGQFNNTNLILDKCVFQRHLFFKAIRGERYYRYSFNTGEIEVVRFANSLSRLCKWCVY